MNNTISRVNSFNPRIRYTRPGCRSGKQGVTLFKKRGLALILQSMPVTQLDCQYKNAICVLQYLLSALKWKQTFNHAKSLMFKYGSRKNSTLVSVWLPWHMHAQTACCLGFKSPLGWDFFLHSSHLSDSEDSDSLL